MISDAYVQVECDQDFCGSREEVNLSWRGNGYDVDEESILRELDWRYDLDGAIECDGCKWNREAEEEDFARMQDIETEKLKELYW